MSERHTILEQLARYVRAADRRDGAAMAQLFAPDGRVEIFYASGDRQEPLGELVGREAIAAAVAHMMKPHPPRGWSHHTTFDPIVEIEGDRATIDAQFIIYSGQGAEKPADGWPAGAFGAPGTITPIESGYYRPVLRRSDEGWQFETHRIFLNIPMAF